MLFSLIKNFPLFLTFSAVLTSNLAAETVTAPSGQLVHYFDFSSEGHKNLPPRAVLQNKGFLLKNDLTHDKKVSLAHADDGALQLNINEEAFGLMLHEEDIHGARLLRLHWGVLEYPEGASYEKGVDNEAIMVYVFFGHKEFSSGSLFIPDSPYFIGFFLCKNDADQLQKPYTGHLYKKSGRFICVDHPPAGETVTTEIDLQQEFRKSFGLDHVPSVSGISIEIDTTDSKNDGKAAAFLKRLEFYN